MKNPFITTGYDSPEYFCDRKVETQKLFSELTNGNNVVLMSPRRMGKTGLIRHCTHVHHLAKDYNVFVIDIYSAQNLKDFIEILGNAVTRQFQTLGDKGRDLFSAIVTGATILLSSGIGEPEWSFRLAVPHAEKTLEQIFEFFKRSNKPCILAIDEFQQVANFPEKNVEALLRTLIQATPDLTVVFAGSSRHLMSQIFCGHSRPFYQSASIMNLSSIEEEEYVRFAQKKFAEANKRISADAVRKVYSYANGITWYVQKILNTLFSMTSEYKVATDECIEKDVVAAMNEILGSLSYSYEELLYRLPSKQKELLLAIGREGVVKRPQSEDFLQRHQLTASSVQSAKRGLMEKDLISDEHERLSINDRFMELWLAMQR